MSDQSLDSSRQILIWPLSLSSASAECLTRTCSKPTITAAKLLQEPTSKWKPVSDNLLHIDAVSCGEPLETKAYRYGEYVYFHSFVQDFLYGKTVDAKTGKSSSGAIQTFRRTDIATVKSRVLDQHGTPIGTAFLSVERMNLYLFDNRTVALVVELKADECAFLPKNAVSGKRERLTLHQAMTLSDRIRRSFPPFLVFPDRNNGKPEPGLFEEEVEWLGAGGKTVVKRSNNWPCHVRQIAEAKASHTPVSNDWLELISPLQIEGFELENAKRTTSLAPFGGR